MPISFSSSLLRSGDTVMSTPSASRQSAAPLLLDAALFPCFATRTPPAAMMSAAVVDILNVFDPSPPVPTISSASSSSRSFMPCALICSADAVISSIVSPFIARAVRYELICISLAPPLMISSITASAVSYERSFPFESSMIASLIIALSSVCLY